MSAYHLSVVMQSLVDMRASDKQCERVAKIVTEWDKETKGDQ
jgi:hypothetical protein